MQLITNLLVILRMAELALVDHFAMGEAIGIVATLFVSFYYSRKQMQKLSIDIETKVLSTIIVKHESEGLYEKSDKEKTRLLIPIYNFMLEQYRPSVAHVPVAEISEGMIPKYILQEQVQEQKMDMPNGMFGEKFTVEGLMENEVTIGDIFQIGSHRLLQLNLEPCYKLGVKFGRMDVLKKFLASGRSGIYFKVSKEGEVGAGDTIEQIGKDPNRITISDIVRLYASEKEDIETMRRAVKVEALPEGWKHYFLEQIKPVEKNKGKSKHK
jgi:hypothetical protein